MKTNLKQIFKLSLIGIVIPLMLSCNKDLSRQEAEKLIIQKYNLPYDDIRDISLFYTKVTRCVSTSRDAHNESSKEGILLNLEQNGLIIYTIERTSSKIIDETWWVGAIGNPTNIDYFTKKVDPNAILKFTIQETYNHIGKLTEKGKQYLVNGTRFKAATTVFGNITGIVETKGLNITEVKYTIIQIPTPIGIAAFNLSNNTLERSASFRKYDDGWRIE